MSQSAPTSRLESGKRSNNTVLLGCLGAALIVFFLLGAGAIWLYFNAKTFIAGAGREVIVQMIEDSGLAEEQKADLIAEVDRLEEGVKGGEIGYEQLTRIGQAIAESPLVGSFVVLAVEAGYLAPSGLSAEEKAAGRQQFERVAQGMIQERIQEEQLDPALDIISQNPGSEGDNREFKDRLSDDELREFLAEIKKIADEAGMPAEPEDLDLAGELRRIIDHALATEG